MSLALGAYTYEKQSPSEKMVVELIEHLQHKLDSQAGFMAKVESTLSYLRYLENRAIYLVKQNEELRDKLCMPLPELKFTMGAEMSPIAFDSKYFYWQMETMGGKTFIPEFPNHTAETEKFWKMVRKQSYKGFLKLFRKKFDENFRQFMTNYK